MPATADPGDDESRYMTAVWCEATRVQLVRLEEAMDDFRAAQAEGGQLSSLLQGKDPGEPQYDMRTVWRLGMEKYFLLHTIAQTRKSVLRLPNDGLPAIRDQKVFRLLRDIDEHWEQIEEGRSLADMRKKDPDAGPGQIRFNNKHVWLGDVSTGELAQWIEDVDSAVHASADAAGSPIPMATDPLV